jgi:cation diffusion facilitator family transporter
MSLSTQDLARTRDRPSTGASVNTNTGTPIRSQAAKRPLSRGSKTALLSIISNSLLIALKALVGVLSGSVSIISEAIHSSTDLIASIIAFISVRRSSIPADKEHPFGHGKIENVSGVIEGILIFIAAGLIINEAVGKIVAPEPIDQAWLAIGVMLFSALVNTLVSRKLYRVSVEEGSMALEADSLHLKTDVYAALGVAFGLLLTLITGWDILDPLVAIVVACLIVKEAFSLCRRGVAFLLDSKLPDEEEARIIAIIESHRNEIEDFHKLKTSRSGAMRNVDFHITLDSQMTVERAHAIVGELKRDISTEFAPTRVSVHIDPVRPPSDQGSTSA